MTIICIISNPGCILECFNITYKSPFSLINHYLFVFLGRWNQFKWCRWLKSAFTRQIWDPPGLLYSAIIMGFENSGFSLGVLPGKIFVTVAYCFGWQFRIRRSTKLGSGPFFAISEFKADKLLTPPTCFFAWAPQVAGRPKYSGWLELRKFQVGRGDHWFWDGWGRPQMIYCKTVISNMICLYKYISQ